MLCKKCGHKLYMSQDGYYHPFSCRENVCSCNTIASVCKSPEPLNDGTELLDKALFFAERKHGNQLDDNGDNYFHSHIKQVFAILQEATLDENTLIAGVLHDTVEDTDTTYEELVKEFNKEIADLVMEMTHEGKKDSIGFYFPRLHSKEAIMIKFADRLSNMSRMQSWTPERQKHYLKRSKFWNDTSKQKTELWVKVGLWLYNRGFIGLIKLAFEYVLVKGSIEPLAKKIEKEIVEA